MPAPLLLSNRVTLTPMTKATAGSVRAVTRALDVLRCFTTERPKLSVAELALELQLSRPTVYRLLATLQKSDFVLAEGEPLRFRLGPAIGALAQVWSSNLNLPQIATAVMEELRREVRETVALMVPRGDHRLCVAELPGPQVLTVVRGVGSTAPLTQGASGRVILAHLPSTAHPHIRDLDKVRRAGYAVSRGELRAGIVALAAPFFDRAGIIAGAIVVSAAEVRFGARRDREVAPIVMGAAQKISALLGRPT
jgi:IclR family transcriptional regulator, acetate operon repressor